ncbi:hypothetical protein [Actinacidiphila glaucinigra]|uniref:hypothetical protein n=1 Tax=Actinacidiphila glaucinigra TaxID=235986 RepID=UPI003718EBB7
MRDHGARMSAGALSAAALLLTVACTPSAPERTQEASESRKPAAGCELRDTTQQSTDRFSELGTVVRTRWCAVDVSGGSDRVPGPNDIRLVGYFDTTAADMKALLDHPYWAFEHSRPKSIPGPVAQAAGTASVSSWMTSTDLERTITRDLYTATFYLDGESNRIVFDTMNPINPKDKVVVVKG